MRDWASVSAKGLATDKTRETWFEGPILAIRMAPPCIILHKVTHRKYMSSHYTPCDWRRYRPAQRLAAGRFEMNSPDLLRPSQHRSSQHPKVSDETVPDLYQTLPICLVLAIRKSWWRSFLRIYLRQKLVIIPRRLGLARRLDAEQVKVTHDPTVVADSCIVGHHIVDGDLAHRRCHSRPVRRPRLGDALEEMANGAVYASLGHRRHPPIAEFAKSLRPLPGLVIEVPIERGGKGEVLGDRESNSVNVGYERLHGNDLLPFGETEFVRLLENVDEVGTAANHGHDLSA